MLSVFFIFIPSVVKLSDEMLSVGAPVLAYCHKAERLGLNLSNLLIFFSLNIFYLV
jgi:hypothetical protein